MKNIIENTKEKRDTTTKQEIEDLILNNKMILENIKLLLELGRGEHMSEEVEAELEGLINSPNEN